MKGFHKVSLDCKCGECNPPKFEDEFPEIANFIIDTYKQKPKFLDYDGSEAYFPKEMSIDDIITYMGGVEKLNYGKHGPYRNKIGRNDACVCGRNKKFKKCCIDLIK